jgi:DNA-binding transcriptional ArsR family regulator
VNLGTGGEPDLDTVFAALANRHRRRIVDLLALQPASIQQLARQIGISLTTIHRHVTVLEDASLVRRRKSGRVNILALDRTGLRSLQEWAKRYRVDWGTNDETLDNYIAGIERANRTSRTSNQKGPQ